MRTFILVIIATGLQLTAALLAQPRGVVDARSDSATPQVDAREVRPGHGWVKVGDSDFVVRDIDTGAVELVCGPGRHQEGNRCCDAMC
jgi:hypothetical protein